MKMDVHRGGCGGCLSVQLRDIPRAPTTYPFAVRSRRATWGHRMGVAVCVRGGSLCVLWYTPCVRGAVARGAPFTSSDLIEREMSGVDGDG